jgi:two-component sensor histidine kinase
VQQHLQSTDGNIEVRPYLTKLCESLATSMIREARSLTLEVASDDATMSSHDAVSLGLVVTELVINCLKHAFPGGGAGAITVGYRVQGNGWTLSVVDDGVGMPEGAALRQGLGTSIVHGLAKQLGATVAVFGAGQGLRISLVSTGDTEGLTNLPSGSI